MTLQAAQATEKVEEAALAKAIDWERGWFVGVYVEQGRPLVPMTAQQRREIYLQQTLATPGSYLKRMFAAGIDQWRESPLAVGRWLGRVRRAFCIARRAVHCGQQPGGAGKRGAEIRTALRSMPLRRILAEDAACDPAQLS